MLCNTTSVAARSGVAVAGIGEADALFGATAVSVALTAACKLFWTRVAVAPKFGVAVKVSANSGATVAVNVAAGVLVAAGSLVRCNQRRAPTTKAITATSKLAVMPIVIRFMRMVPSSPG